MKKFGIVISVFALCFLSMGFQQVVIEGVVSDEAGAKVCVSQAKSLLKILGLTIDRDIYLRVEDSSSVQTHFSNSGVSGENVIAFYQAHDPECMFVTKGYKQTLTTVICAHELTHAWQSDNCPLQDKAITEGFAYWIESQAALLLHRSDLAAMASRCSGTDPKEVKVFAYLQKLNQSGGLKAVLDYVKTARDFKE